MATETFPQDVALTSGRDESRQLALGSTIRTLLKPLASLKLTVALFLLAIIIILFGTLAQWRKDIWEVIAEYFRTAFAWVEFKDLLAPALFGELHKHVWGGFYFPGGWLIGAAMAVNLVAAHLVRFTVQTSGARLRAGLAVIGVGILLTWLVVASGSNKEGLQDAPLISWAMLWNLFVGGLGVLWLATVYALIRVKDQRRLERGLLFAASIILGGLLGWILFQGESARLNDSGMRILWQLTKGGFAGLVLLAGCVMAFKKRAGIVLLHAGIGLMMFGELLVGTTAVEAQMWMREGETVNYTRDIRNLELAVIDPSDSQTDHLVVVPQKILLDGGTISDEQLPFDLELVEFYKNSELKRVESDENPATAGAGLQLRAEEVRAGTGTDTSGAVDNAAAYVRLKAKDGSKDYGTYLVSTWFDSPMQVSYLRHLPVYRFTGELPQRVDVDGKTYELSLRFQRSYKPYSMTLLDVRKDDYIGTDTPRNYSSDVRLVEPGRNVDREIKIWMNNPLRFAGETFYQSNYLRNPWDQTEATALQVVTNTGWMIPYVACMLVAVGMLAHFSIVLVRFLNRQAAAEPQFAENVVAGAKSRGVPPRSVPTRPGSLDGSWETKLFPAAIVLIFGIWVLGQMRPPEAKDGEMKLYEFGQLPLVYQGRVKPFDTLARNTLQIVSDRQEWVDENGDKQPAIKWLLDVIARPEEAAKHKVFRIENLEVLETLGLERRKGFRYATQELQPNIGELEKQARLAQEREAGSLSIYQRKVLELEKRLRAYITVVNAFQAPDLPEMPTAEELEQDHAGAMAKIRRLTQFLVAQSEQLEKIHPPRAVPFRSEGESDKPDWEPYATALNKAYVQASVLGMNPDAATVSLLTMFRAYGKGDAGTFNEELSKYKAALAARPPKDMNLSKVGFETFFNHFAPFYVAMIVYVIAFVVTACGWLGWTRPLNRAAFWLIVLGLAVHTFALVSRIYISGRPPVTNLYSSAVFIGWGAVVFGLVMELIFRMGIGNVIATVIGFATLFISHQLAADGDTFTVLQAVLDTQFWLATHVTCITLGYMTTYVAGALGVIYIMAGALTPSLSPKLGRDLVRMMYGALCFAIFFSFVGTVLGGLWADDSWGRFWGWDPKENGALMIVLWNALVLHARWGNMVKDRGLAALVTLGNIVVSWSWWGVNELGVGLHSYGFTEGVLRALGFFTISQLMVVALALMPKDWWRSFRQQPRQSLA